MKKILLLAAVAVGLAIMPGCDYVRTIAGRPTSAEIAAKKAEIEAAEAAKAKAAAEEAARQEAARREAECAAALDASGVIMRTSEEMRRLDISALDAPYYISAGAFGSKANAEKLAAKAREAGFEAVLAPLGSSMTSVLLCPSHSKTELYEALTALKGHDFCPADAWILITGK